MGIQKIHLCQALLPWVAVNHPLHLGIKFTDRKFSLSKKIAAQIRKSIIHRRIKLVSLKPDACFFPDFAY